MYAVVGCPECEHLWIVAGRPETSQCPRCGHRREHALRTKFATSEDADAAREARSRLLAERQDHEEAFASVESFADLEAAVDEAAVDDDTYLEASGVDPEAADEAGERASGGGESRSRTETVRAALRTVDEPTAADVRAYCGEHGVDPAFVDEVLARLRQSGEVTVRDGTYRLL